MPIRVKLNYVGLLRRAFSVSSEFSDCNEGVSAADLFVQKVRHLPQPTSLELLNADGHPSASILLFINGNQVEWSSPTTLQNGDELTLLSPLAGG